ncbi:MAG: hypothetical protein JWN14_3792 [Chthonomonadales bacterium]|nr:hypothetical protein [Chthonomonadales bacterium]
MRLHTPAFAAVFGLCLAQAQAQTIIYNNLATFTGNGFTNGTATVQSGNDITKLVADDINFATGSTGAIVTQFTFTVANFNATTVSARPLVRFYTNGGTGGGPGTFLGGANFAPITFNAGSVGSFTAPLGSYFIVPTANSVWAALTFDDNNGATGATATQLNGLGQGIFNTPTVGSIQDAFFQSTADGSFASSNPAGSVFSFGGSPVANFGWRFSAITPEPGSTALFVGMGLSGGFVFKRRKRKNKK